MSNKAFFGVVAALIVIVLGGAIFLNQKDNQEEKQKPADIAKVTDQDHVKGSENPKVTLIEYGDFQCPYCGAVYPIIEQVLPEYNKDVQFVFRHFPITSIHPNALVAHKAAEAAGKQDKFWEMYDKIYQNQQAWSNESKPIEVFEGYAKELKLDMDKYNADFDSTAVTNRINSDKNDGESAGVESTPTIFINGKQIEAPRSADELREQLDKAIKNASSDKDSKD